MATENEDLLAAISAGIDNASGTPPTPEVDDGDATDDAESGDSASDVSGEEEVDSAATDSTDSDTSEGSGDSDDAASEDEGGEADSDADDSGQSRGADGKFTKKDAAKGGAADAEKAGKDAANANKSAGAKDPINDPIPDGLKKETRERMVSLVSAAKTISAERDQAISERDELVQVITETGATPQQYGDAMNALRLLNSSDPAEVEQGITFLQQVITINAKAIGKPIPGVDFLADHKDLQEEVLNGTMSEERAVELAAMRSRTAASTAQTQNANRQSQQEAAQARALQSGAAALNALEAQLKASDTQYLAKRAILVGALRPVIARAKPEDWAAIWKNAYDNLKLPAPAKPAAKKGVPANQPLRGKNPSGGQQKAPGSLLDAITMGIENASGR